MEFWEIVALAKAGKGGGSVPPEQISEAVDDWLEDNVDPETGYVLDSSLTISNAAAPADKVGELKSAISKDNSRLEKYDGGITTDWEIGALSQNTNLTPPCTYILLRNGIRTSEGTTLHLHPGDVFSVTSFTGVKINAYGRKTSDGTAVIKDNRTEAIVIEYEGDYALSVAYTDTTVIADFNTLMDLVVLKRYENTIADVQNIQNELKPFEDISIGNLMPNLSEWVAGRVYNGVYSELITTVECTDYIPVIGGRTYYLYGGFISTEYFGVYDANKQVISGWSFSSVTTDASNASKAVITLNQNARFIRINALVNALAQFPTDAYIGLYPNNMAKALDVSDYVPRIKGNGTLSNKKILVIGDSISTDYYGGYKKWVTALCENCFFSSGFVNNSSYHATGYVATYKEGGVVMQGTFLTRVSAITDLDEYDMIITFGGINDWIQGVDFNEFKDAVDDYYAYLIENATQARIAVIAPLRTSQYGATNSVYKTQKDYSDYIKSVAADYSFPVLNLTDEGGFCPEKSTTFRDMWTLLPAGTTSHDGVHPTETWEKKYLAPQIAWFLAGLI